MRIQVVFDEPHQDDRWPRINHIDNLDVDHWADVVRNRDRGVAVPHRLNSV